MAVLVLAGTSPTVIAQGEIVEPDLSAMAIGSIEDEFTFARTGQGDTRKRDIITEPSVKLRLAIAQLSQNRTDYRFPLAIYRPLSIRNAKVSVRFKPVAGRVDQAAGIAVRLADPDDYYVARANALEDNVRFYRVVQGNRQQLAGTNQKVTSGEWHTLTLAGAFAIAPDLLLIDEPFLSLDAAAADRLRSLLLRLVSTRPATVLFVTHDLAEAVELADRILVLSPAPGRVAADMPIAVARTERRDRDTLAALRAELARLGGHPLEPSSLNGAGVASATP